MTRLVAVACLLVASLPGLGEPALRVDPIPSTVPQTFPVHGACLACDALHVYAWPASGPVFLGAAYPTEAMPTLQSETGAFTLIVRNAPIGTYPVVIYAHDPASNTFPTQVGYTVTVRACAWVAEDYQWEGPSGPVFWMFSLCR